MMGNSFLAGPRRGRTRAIVAVVGLTLILAAAGMVRLFDGEDDAPAGAAAAPSPAVSPLGGQDPDSVTGVPADSSPTTGARQPLRLVRGARVVAGVRVGYPHTLVGVVSAAIEYSTQICSTLDPDRAAEVGRAVGDSSLGDIRAHFARGPVNSRRHLGLPESGPVPAGASMTFGAVAYQTRDAHRDQVTILLLAYLTTTTPAAGVQARLGVFPVQMVWTSDWKVAIRSDSARDYAELRHQPGSAQALAAGWQDFTP